MRGLQTCVCNGGECVVVDAVRFEPVSEPNSLITGKIQGISPIWTCFRFGDRYSRCYFNDLRLNSLLTEQGI